MAAITTEDQLSQEIDKINSSSLSSKEKARLVKEKTDSYNKHKPTDTMKKTSDNIAKATNAGVANGKGSSSLADNPKAAKAQSVVDNPSSTKEEADEAVKAPKQEQDAASIVALSGTNDDGTIQADKEVTEPEAKEADKTLFTSGLMNEDGTFNKDALLSYVAKPSQGPSTLMKVLNIIGGLIHTATLGIVPRIDFMGITGQTELLKRINDQIDQYNDFQKENVTNANNAQIAAYEGGGAKRTGHEADKANAASTADADIKNAEKLGEFNFAATDKAVRSFDRDTQKQILDIQNVYAQQMAKVQSLQQRGLMQQAHDLQASLQADMTKQLMGVYNRMSQQDRDNFAKAVKATNGTTFADQALKYIEQGVDTVAGAVK